MESEIIERLNRLIRRCKEYNELGSLLSPVLVREDLEKILDLAYKIKRANESGTIPKAPAKENT